MTATPFARRASVALSVSIVACALVVVALAGGLFVSWTDSDRQVVQGTELDRAGSQRRLAERIALDVALLDGWDGETAVAEELVETVALLEQTRFGLLDGDDDFGLDGRLPDSVVELYSPDGLDLSARLARYETAALAVATGTANADDVGVIRSEANGQRLVLDLNQVVAELSRVAVEGQQEESLLIDVGLVVVVLLGVVSIVSMWIALRASRAQSRHGDQLEDELVESEALKRATVDALVDGVVIQDEDGNVVSTNLAARTLLETYLAGLAPSKGDHFRSSLPTMFGLDREPLDPDERPLAKALRTDAPVVGGIIGTTLDDGDHWFRWNAVPVPDPRNDRRLVVMTFAEITHQRRLIAELEKERERFQLAFEHAPIGKAIVASDGTFVEVNPAVCEILQRNRTELFGARFQDITHPDDLETDVALVDSLLDGQADSYHLEKRYLSPAGDVIHALLGVAVVRPERSEPYFIAQIVDIGDRKRSEASQLAALDREREVVTRLRELDASKTQFVSTVSHELRTPLTSINGYVEMLLDGSGGELNDGQMRMLTTIERNGVRLLTLIEDLLTMSRIDSDRLEIERSPLFVSDLVGSVLQDLAPIASANGVSLRGPSDVPATVVEGDRDSLERVLVNLTNNAIKFTPTGGDVRLGVEVDGSDVVMTVADDGVGIPADEQERVFERFFRTSSSHANAIPGSGLGLAIARELVIVHGGTIDLDSEEGRGTTVTVRLPIAGGTAAPPGERTSAVVVDAVS